MRSPSRLFHGEIGVADEQALRAIFPFGLSGAIKLLLVFYRTYNGSELCGDVAWTELDDIVPEVEEVDLLES
jgi:hypothetical protein